MQHEAVLDHYALLMQTHKAHVLSLHQAHNV